MNEEIRTGSFTAPPGTPMPNMARADDDGGLTLWTVTDEGITEWEPVGNMLIICRHCSDERHPDCPGYAMNFTTDTVVKCECPHLD